MTARTLAEAKAQAAALRDALGRDGTRISHAQALEAVAKQNGARDWNTLHARLARAEPAPFQLGQSVRGHYLGQAFSGRIQSVAKVGRHFDLSIQLDTPIDTVRFASFSNLRRRIGGVVAPDGRSPRKTSDGEPQLIVAVTGGG
jgi:hypothetical protein